MTKRRSRRQRARKNQPTTNRTIVTGSQEMSLVTTPTPSGTYVGGQLPLIPTFEAGSRLSRVAVEYSQYNIVSSVVEYVPHCTTTTSGRLVTAWTFDPLESTPVSVRQLVQIANSKMSRLYLGFSNKMPTRAPDKRRFPVLEAAQFAALDAVDKLMYLPATLVFGLDGSAQSGLTVGSLIWHYKIEFFNPNLVIGATLTANTLSTEIYNGPSPTYTTIAPVSEEQDEE